MNTQIDFDLSSQTLKERAIKKAKKQGLTTKGLFNFLLQSYVDNKININSNADLSTSDDTFFTEEDKKDYLRAKKDLDNEINTISFDELKTKYGF